jgi:uncharacterized protein YciI
MRAYGCLTPSGVRHPFGPLRPRPAPDTRYRSVRENAESTWRCRLYYFLVTELPGPGWDTSRPRREQEGWGEHVAFIDSLVAEGVLVLGGPVGDTDFGPALLVFAAESESEVHGYLSGDPWLNTILRVDSVQRWSIWIGSLAD